MEYHIVVDAVANEIRVNKKLVYKAGRVLDEKLYKLAYNVYRKPIIELKDLLKEGEVITFVKIYPTGKRTGFIIYKTRGEIRVKGISGFERV